MPRLKLGPTEEYLRQRRQLTGRDQETTRNIEYNIENHSERKRYLYTESSGKPVWGMFGMYLYTAFKIVTSPIWGPVAVLLRIGRWLPPMEAQDDDVENRSGS